MASGHALVDNASEMAVGHRFVQRQQSPGLRLDGFSAEGLGWQVTTQRQPY